MIVRIPRFSARFSAVLRMRAAHGANRLRRFAQVRAASPQLPRALRALAKPTAHFSEQSRATAFQTLATSPTRQNAAIVMIVRIPRFSARFSAVLRMRAAHGANRLRRFAQVRAASPQLPRALRALAKPTAHFSEQSRAAAFQTLATFPTRQNAAIVMIVQFRSFRRGFPLFSVCAQRTEQTDFVGSPRFARLRRSFTRALRAPKMQQNPPAKSVGGLNVIYDVLRPLRSWILPSKRELQDRASLQR